MPFKKGQSGNPGGKPKGAKRKTTLDKEAAREALRELVKENLRPMVEAQVKHAQGIKYLVYRESKGGKFTKLSADKAEEIFQRAENEGVVIEVWDKEPSVQAFTDLMNRTLDKPAETVQAEVSHTIKVYKWKS